MLSCVSSPQLVANAVLFVCVNCVGIFHRWMTEHDLRTSNQKREEYSAIRSQKEIKKYQQVKQGCSNASYLVFRSAIVPRRRLSAAGQIKSLRVIALIKRLFTWTAWLCYCMLFWLLGQ